MRFIIDTGNKHIRIRDSAKSLILILSDSNSFLQLAQLVNYLAMI